MKSIPKFAINDGRNLLFLSKEDILYCLAEGSYTKVYLVNKEKILLSKNIKVVADNLPKAEFVRVHQSCVINLAHVCSYTNGNLSVVLMSNGEEISVSRNRKSLFLSLFKKI